MADRAPRTKNVEDAQLDPSSLVGSYLHRPSEGGWWQGVVVGEPHPGVYLIEWFSWVMGEPTHQSLVRIEDMGDCRFYDDAEWMKNSYEHSLKDRAPSER